MIRKQRELDDAKREIDLTIEKRVQESLGKTRDQAKQEAEEQLGLKVAEKEQTIVAMQRQIEDLRRKAEQGSQQLQGEVLELELESIRAGKFPHDRIEPVPKGEHGGDILHRVITPTGVGCGTILWKPNARKTGATVGSQSCATISEPPARKSPFSSAPFSPRVLRRSTS